MRRSGRRGEGGDVPSRRTRRGQFRKAGGSLSFRQRREERFVSAKAGAIRLNDEGERKGGSLSLASATSVDRIVSTSMAVGEAAAHASA